MHILVFRVAFYQLIERVAVVSKKKNESVVFHRVKEITGKSGDQDLVEDMNVWAIGSVATVNGLSSTPPHLSHV